MFNFGCIYNNKSGFTSWQVLTNHRPQPPWPFFKVSNLGVVALCGDCRDIPTVALLLGRFRQIIGLSLFGLFSADTHQAGLGSSLTQSVEGLEVKVSNVGVESILPFCAWFFQALKIFLGGLHDL